MTTTARRTPTGLICAAVAVSLAAMAAGCGNSAYNGSGAQSATTATSQSAPARAAGRKLMLSADEDGGLYFTPRKLAATAGTVTLVMDNPKSTGKPHGIAVEGNGVDKDGPTVKPGQSSTLTVALKPGKYTFYCPVPGHKAGGMKGTLTVK
ncbi:MAG: hypothetical protein QOJ46_1379 [bacterium]|jgi:uncharacterized cupredoxin-like copper-binding protein